MSFVGRKGFLGGSEVKKKKSSCNAGDMGRHRLGLWVRKFSWRRKWQHTPVFLPGKSHGQRRLTSYKESEVTVHST